MSQSQSSIPHSSSVREANPASSGGTRFMVGSHSASNSQHDGSASQTQSEVLTQNPDLTQIGDFDDDTLSPLPFYSPSAQQKIPWGRLMPCSLSARKGVDLLPRPPTEEKPTTSTSKLAIVRTGTAHSVLGLDNIQTGDIFNEYVLGRSPKSDIVASKEAGELEEPGEQVLDWAFGMISNKHCRIYCMVEESNRASSNKFSVFVEDTSGNGTLVNKNVLLRRGEKRLLHSGDEICLINPHILSRKVRKKTVLQPVLQQFSFVFVNVVQQQAVFPSLHDTVTGKIRAQPQPNRGRLSLSSIPSSGKKRRGAVDPRSMKQHSWQKPAPRPAFAMKNTGVGSVTSTEVPGATAGGNNRRISPRRRPPRRIEEDYDIRDVIGSGTVGQVRRAIDRKTGQARAVKIIASRVGLMKTNVSEANAALEAEAAILQELEHPYVVKLVDFYVTSSTVYLVMELLEGGDLFDRIVTKGKYTETESRRVMRRLLCAIYYLHEERQVVHRDLKPENILLLSRDSDVDIQLTDFGLAKAVNSEGLKTFCGTPLYFAPEILQRRNTVLGRGRYGKQADMWSLGVILYVLLSGVPPFDLGGNGVDLGPGASNIQFPQEHWAGVSEEAKDLVRLLLMIDPRKRISVREACGHSWVLQEDGDTHQHPLDDPKLPVSQKRLFPYPASAVNDSPTGTSSNDKTSQELESMNNPLGSETPGTTSESKGDCEQGARRITPESTEGALESMAHPESSAEKSLPEDEDRQRSECGSSDPPQPTDQPLETNRESDEAASLIDQPAMTAGRREPLSPLSFNADAKDVPSLHNHGSCEQKWTGRQSKVPGASKCQSTSKVGDGRLASKPITGEASKERRSLGAAELSDDGVLSDFSEKTESVSSFGSTNAEDVACETTNVDAETEDAPTIALLPNNEDVHGARPKPRRRRVTESLGEVQTRSSMKATHRSAVRPSKRARSKPRSTSKKQDGKKGKQTTLAHWFKNG